MDAFKKIGAKPTAVEAQLVWKTFGVFQLRFCGEFCEKFKIFCFSVFKQREDREMTWLVFFIRWFNLLKPVKNVAN